MVYDKYGPTALIALIAGIVLIILLIRYFYGKG